jgi:hypothetical protein
MRKVIDNVGPIKSMKNGTPGVSRREISRRHHLADVPDCVAEQKDGCRADRRSLKSDAPPKGQASSNVSLRHNQ